MEGNDYREHGEGKLYATDGRFVAYGPKSYPGRGLYLIDTSSENVLRVQEGASYETICNGRIYYVLNEDKSFSLCSVNFDGTNDRVLFSSDNSFTEYDDHITFGEMRFPIINGEEYVYFSYGSVAGTGIFYSGGQIARVKTDGTQAEIIAGNDTSNLVSPDFSVNADGSIEIYDYTRIGEGLYSSGMHTFYIEYGLESNDRTVCSIELSNGESIIVLKQEDATLFPDEFGGLVAGEQDGEWFLDVEEVELIGCKAFVRLNYCVEAHEADIGWRTGYRRVSSALLMKDLTSGRIDVLDIY